MGGGGGGCLVLVFVGFWLVFVWGGLFGVVGDFVWVFCCCGVWLFGVFFFKSYL